MQNDATVFFHIIKYWGEYVSVLVQRVLLQSYDGMHWIQPVKMDCEIHLRNGPRAVSWMRNVRRISKPHKAALMVSASLPSQLGLSLLVAL